MYGKRETAWDLQARGASMEASGERPASTLLPLDRLEDVAVPSVAVPHASSNPSHALRAIAKLGSVEDMRVHLAAHPFKEEENESGTPLMIAAAYGHSSCVELLLTAGASPNFVGRSDVAGTNRGVLAAPTTMAAAAAAAAAAHVWQRRERFEGSLMEARPSCPAVRRGLRAARSMAQRVDDAPIHQCTGRPHRMRPAAA